MTTPVFKVLTAAEWAAFERDGRFDGSPLDREHGYIHLSAPDQVAGVVQRYFAGRPGLVVVALDHHRMGKAMRWEHVRGGTDFPHLYGALTADMVISADPIPDDPEQRALAMALLAV